MSRLILNELPENAAQSTLLSRQTDQRARSFIAALAKGYYGTDDKTQWTPNPINPFSLSTDPPHAKARLEHVCQKVLHKTIGSAQLIVSSYIMGRAFAGSREERNLAPHMCTLHVKNLQKRGIIMYPLDEEFLHLQEETLKVVNSLGLPARSDSLRNYQRSPYGRSVTGRRQAKGVFDYQGADWESDTQRLDQVLTALFQHVDRREELIIFDAPLVMKRFQSIQRLPETRRALLGLSQSNGSTSIAPQTGDNEQTLP